MMERRTLVVAAHPDDEVLGCGGAIAKARDAGEAVRVVFLAEGITARYKPAEFDHPEVVDEISRRNANAYRALSILGVEKSDVFTHARYCCRLDQVPLIDLTKEIEEHIRTFRPTHVLCHAPHDANIDHQCLHKATLAATRPVPGTGCPMLLAFEILSSTEWNPIHPFPASYFVKIDAQIDRKVAALAAYENEMQPAPHPRSEEVVRALATYRGAQCGVFAAEAFMLIRALEV